MLTAVIVPGHGYSAQAPLLDLAAHALFDLRTTVETITWTVPDGLFDIGPEPFVRAHVSTALYRLAAAGPDPRPVLIAKSLGTFAAVLAAERALPAIWLTPLLRDQLIVEAITRNPAPALLIGGTADRTWRAEAAAATGKQVVTVEGANHALRPPGPLSAYVEALGTVAAAMESFLARLR